MEVVTRGTQSNAAKSSRAALANLFIYSMSISEPSARYKTFVAHTEHVNFINFNPKNRSFFATGSDDQTVKLWDHRKLNVPATILNSGIVRNICWAESQQSGVKEFIMFHGDTVKTYISVENDIKEKKTIRAPYKTHTRTRCKI